MAKKHLTFKGITERLGIPPIEINRILEEYHLELDEFIIGENKWTLYSLEILPKIVNIYRKEKRCLTHQR